MTTNEFAAWAAERGLRPDAIDQLARVAASPEEMQAAFDSVELPPPIYSLRDIQGMTDDFGYGISPTEHGFIFVGACPNGDPIALDVEDEPGSVWYVCMVEMQDTPLREIAIRVADNVESLLRQMTEEDGFPIDYYSAEDMGY